MKALERLYERSGIPLFGLSPPLAAMYGGDFGLPSPGVYANFVSAVDGVVSLPGSEESGHVISSGDEADRFVMGLLRASVDAVLIGAGTFRKDTGHFWRPEHVCPEAGSLFAGLRAQLGLRPHPILVVVTASGQIDTGQPALHDCIIITSPAGQLRLAEGLPPGARIMVLDTQPFDGHLLLDRLRLEGLQRILVEGGPTLVGNLLQRNLINELFLTISPRLYGRQPADERKSLVEGIDLGGAAVKLLGIRRHDSYLFLRYQL
jgi:riboflavin biosynthesis pyrimidine reductase